MTLLKCHPQPIMVLNRRLRKNSSHCVSFDQQASSLAAVTQLVELGHRDIAFITGSLDSPTGTERLSGYKDALARHGIPLREALIIKGKWTAASRAEGVRQLLANGSRFSALVTSNNNMAIGAMKQLHQQGIRVPTQVSVIGLNDVALAPWMIPALSSVKVPVTEMVKEAINRLIFMLDGSEFTSKSAFSGELIRRESVINGPRG